MILKIFLRLLLSQAVWNIEKMQNIGFLWSVLPALKKIYPERNALKNAVKRNLDYFNTHPYFIGIFAGIMLLWEEKNYELVQKVKISYGGPMAALGTHIFWSTLRPAAGMLAILIAWLKGDAYLPAIVFFILYNLFHLPLRYYFIAESSRSGLNFFYILKRININKLIWYLQLLGVFTAFSAVVCYLRYYLVDDIVLIHAFIFVIVATAILHLFFKSISGLKIFYAVIAISIVLNYL